MKQEDIYQMNKKEIARMEVIKRVLTERTYTARQASEDLGISRRHARRLIKRFREEGPRGLISRKRGQPSNRKYPDMLRDRVLGLIETHYHDLSFTLIGEELQEAWEIKVSREQIRQWMISAGK